MDKEYLSPMQMLEYSAQHAYLAEYLLQKNGEIIFDDKTQIDGLLPITTLLYTAIELTLKAYLFHSHNAIHRHMKLTELIEANHDLELSDNHIDLLKVLMKTQAFRKGIDYPLWKNREEFHAFCERIMTIYVNLHDMMPLELQKDYIN